MVPEGLPCIDHPPVGVRGEEDVVEVKAEQGLGTSLSPLGKAGLDGLGELEMEIGGMKIGEREREREREEREGERGERERGETVPLCTVPCSLPCPSLRPVP